MLSQEAIAIAIGLSAVVQIALAVYMMRYVD